MILVRNIRLPLSCPDPEQEAVRQAYRTLRLRGNASSQRHKSKKRNQRSFHQSGIPAQN